MTGGWSRGFNFGFGDIMAGGWSNGWNFGFGPVFTQVSGLNPTTMQILGYTVTEKMLYDYGNTEGFYVLVSPPEVTSTTLYSVSPAFASQWFGQNGSVVTVVYNPFQSMWYQNFSGLNG